MMFMDALAKAYAKLQSRESSLEIKSRKKVEKIATKLFQRWCNKNGVAYHKCATIFKVENLIESNRFRPGKDNYIHAYVRFNDAAYIIIFHFKQYSFWGIKYFSLSSTQVSKQCIDCKRTYEGPYRYRFGDLYEDMIDTECKCLSCQFKNEMPLARRRPEFPPVGIVKES